MAAETPTFAEISALIAFHDQDEFTVTPRLIKLVRELGDQLRPYRPGTGDQAVIVLYNCHATDEDETEAWLRPELYAQLMTPLAALGIATMPTDEGGLFFAAETWERLCTAMGDRR